jgi:DNA-binding transcriptional MerR regulator
LMKGVAVSDLIRSMLRMGFSREEIYEVLAGAGVFGEEIHLLMEHLRAEFEESGLEARPSHLAGELLRALKPELEALVREVTARLDSLRLEVEEMGEELRRRRRRARG